MQLRRVALCDQNIARSRGTDRVPLTAEASAPTFCEQLYPVGSYLKLALTDLRLTVGGRREMSYYVSCRTLQLS